MEIETKMFIKDELKVISKKYNIECNSLYKLFLNKLLNRKDELLNSYNLSELNADSYIKMIEYDQYHIIELDTNLIFSNTNHILKGRLVDNIPVWY